jgi:hypothetical protein
LETLSRLLLVLFVALIGAAVVSNALPQIIGALGGTQSQYTWVVTATTRSGGKLAGLFDKSPGPAVTAVGDAGARSRGWASFCTHGSRVVAALSVDPFARTVIISPTDLGHDHPGRWEIDPAQRIIRTRAR